MSYALPMFNFSEAEMERKTWMEGGVTLYGPHASRIFWPDKDQKEIDFYPTPKDPKATPTKGPKENSPAEGPPYSELLAVVTLQKKQLDTLRTELKDVYAEMGLSEESTQTLMAEVAPSSGKFL